MNGATRSSAPARRLLYAAWLAAFSGGLACFAVFAYGVLASVHYGDPALRVELAHSSDWRSVPFRVWGAGRRDLALTTVNADRTRAGTRFEGALAVRIFDPDGRVFFEGNYPAGTIEHELAENYYWTGLASLTLDDWPLREWRLAARVVRGDARFAQAHSEIELRTHRYDPGMGGLLYYTMILPAAGLMLVAAGLGACLARRGASRLPLAASIAGLAGIAAMLL
ncbi:MAG TPA: hypothetical protein VNK67_05675 [Burkholderiales bacterium]|nr:hypothetical protein [Burkholderiales bacterium]